jgi:hypothetical protein
MDCKRHRVLGTRERRSHDADWRAIVDAVTAGKGGYERIVQFARLLERFPESWLMNSGGRCFADKKDYQQVMRITVAE